MPVEYRTPSSNHPHGARLATARRGGCRHGLRRSDPGGRGTRAHGAGVGSGAAGRQQLLVEPGPTGGCGRRCAPSGNCPACAWRSSGGCAPTSAWPGPALPLRHGDLRRLGAAPRARRQPFRLVHPQPRPGHPASRALLPLARSAAAHRRPDGGHRAAGGRRNFEARGAPPLQLETEVARKSRTRWRPSAACSTSAHLSDGTATIRSSSRSTGTPRRRSTTCATPVDSVRARGACGRARPGGATVPLWRADVDLHGRSDRRSRRTTLAPPRRHKPPGGPVGATEARGSPADVQRRARPDTVAALGVLRPISRAPRLPLSPRAGRTRWAPASVRPWRLPPPAHRRPEPPHRRRTHVRLDQIARVRDTVAELPRPR